MNELDLKQWGVQNMNDNELATVEGGTVWEWICGAAEAVAGFAQDVAERFVEEWNELSISISGTRVK